MQIRRLGSAFAFLLASVVAAGVPAASATPAGADAKGFDRWLTSETRRLKGVEKRADRAQGELDAASSALSSRILGFDDAGDYERTRTRIESIARACRARVLDWTAEAPKAVVAFTVREHRLSLQGESLGSLVCVADAASRFSDNPMVEALVAESESYWARGALVLLTLHLQDPLPWSSGPPLEAFPPLLEGATARQLERYNEVARLRTLEVEAEDAERAAADLRGWTPGLVAIETSRNDVAAELAALKDASLAGTLGPGQVGWLPGSLTVAGVVSKPGFARTLGAAWPKGAELDLSGLKVVPVAPFVAPEDLPPLGGRAVDLAAAVQVHAVDADLAALRFALADAAHPMIRAGAPAEEVTFALSAPTVSHALEQLQSAFPTSAETVQIPQDEGPRVTAALFDGEARAVLKSLSAVLGKPISSPEGLSAITVHVTDAPAEGVLRALAAELELDVSKQEGGFVLTGADRPAVPLGSTPQATDIPIGVVRIAATVVRPDGSVSIEQRRDATWLIRTGNVAPDGTERLVLAGSVEEHLLMEAEGGGWEKVVLQIELQGRDPVRMPRPPTRAESRPAD